MQGVSKVEALRITGTVFQNAIALKPCPGPPPHLPVTSCRICCKMSANAAGARPREAPLPRLSAIPRKTTLATPER